MKIIIVEDEAAIREGMEGILKKLSPSYEVIGKAENGREGLSLIRSLRPDVILLDIRMPDMDGMSAAKARLLHWQIWRSQRSDREMLCCDWQEPEMYCPNPLGLLLMPGLRIPP